MVRLPVGRNYPLGFMAVVDQNRSAAGPPACLDVVEDIAQKPGIPEHDAVFASRLEKHSGLGFSTEANGRIRFDFALGMMRAVIETPERHPRLRKELRK